MKNYKRHISLVILLFPLSHLMFVAKKCTGIVKIYFFTVVPLKSWWYSKNWQPFCSLMTILDVVYLLPARLSIQDLKHVRRISLQLNVVNEKGYLVAKNYQTYKITHILCFVHPIKFSLPADKSSGRIWQPAWPWYINPDCFSCFIL